MNRRKFLSMIIPAIAVGGAGATLVHGSANTTGAILSEADIDKLAYDAVEEAVEKMFEQHVELVDGV